MSRNRSSQREEAHWAHLDTATKANVSIRSEFRVYAANAAMRRNRLKAELRTGAMRGCARRLVRARQSPELADGPSALRSSAAKRAE